MSRQGVLVLTLLAFLRSIVIAQSATCPPTGLPDECACHEETKSISCSLGPLADVVSVLSALEAAASSNGVTAFDELILSSDLADDGITITIPANSITQLQFSRITIFSHFSSLQFDLEAFPGTYGFTEEIVHSDHTFLEQTEAFAFFKKFTKLKHLSFDASEIPGIPDSAFSGMASLESLFLSNSGILRIGTQPFAGLASTVQVHLDDNLITVDGISDTAFNGITPGGKINLKANTGITHLPQAKFKTFLDTVNTELTVGAEDGETDPVFFLNCDNRADWICANSEVYRGKLVGFACKEDEFEDIFEYCSRPQSSTMPQTSPTTTISTTTPLPTTTLSPTTTPIPTTTPSPTTITLYSGTDCTGFYLSIPEYDHPDITVHQFGNVGSVKIQGSWLLYSKINYNGEEDGEVTHLQSKEYTCQEFLVEEATVSSLRMLSHHDEVYVPNSLTLFVGNNSQGVQQLFYAFQAVAINPENKSLIIVGTEAWTIYKNADYSGPALCLRPQTTNPGEPTFVVNLTAFNPPIPYDFIKSVEIGCNSRDIVMLS